MITSSVHISFNNLNNLSCALLNSALQAPCSMPLFPMGKSNPQTGSELAEGRAATITGMEPWLLGWSY